MPKTPSVCGLRRSRTSTTPTRSQFTQPETRDVREIVNKDQAKVEQAKALLEKDDSAANWKKVAAKYSTDTGHEGQRRPAQGRHQGPERSRPRRPDLLRPPGAARRPVQGPGGLLPDPGREDHPGATTPLSKVSTQIKQQLGQGNQQEVATDFQTGLPRQVERADLLRRRLRDRPLRQLHAAGPRTATPGRLRP